MEKKIGYIATKNFKQDELIFEVVEEELETMQEMVKRQMEGVVSLKVPLKVDMGIGVNWFDLK